MTIHNRLVISATTADADAFGKLVGRACVSNLTERQLYWYIVGDRVGRQVIDDLIAICAAGPDAMRATLEAINSQVNHALKHGTTEQAASVRNAAWKFCNNFRSQGSQGRYPAVATFYSGWTIKGASAMGTKPTSPLPEHVQLELVAAVRKPTAKPESYSLADLATAVAQRAGLPTGTPDERRAAADAIIAMVNAALNADRKPASRKAAKTVKAA